MCLLTLCGVVHGHRPNSRLSVGALSVACHILAHLFRCRLATTRLTVIKHGVVLNSHVNDSGTYVRALIIAALLTNGTLDVGRLSSATHLAGAKTVLLCYRVL